MRTARKVFFFIMSNENTKAKYISGTCNISRRKVTNAKLFKFSSPDLTCEHIWREKCKIAEHYYHKNLYICDRHFESTFVGSRRLKADAIPTLFLDVEEIETYDFPTPPCVVPQICSNCESNEKLGKCYKQKYYFILKKFNRLRNMYKKKIIGH